MSDRVINHNRKSIQWFSRLAFINLPYKKMESSFLLFQYSLEAQFNYGGW